MAPTVGLDVEGVRVRVVAQVGQLAPDDADQQLGQRTVGGVLGDPQVRQHLGGGVAEPHRGDVTGDHEDRPVLQDVQGASR